MSLLITIDTLRADAVGAYGQPGGVTPWIDRLAAAGTRFTNAHAHNVVTLPSHANILSGRLPTRARRPRQRRVPLSTRPSTRSRRSSKSHGYRTGAFVSAFPLESRFGLARGFDVYDDRFADAARPAFLIQERSGRDTVASGQPLARVPARMIGGSAGCTSTNRTFRTRPRNRLPRDFRAIPYHAESRDRRRRARCPCWSRS